MKRAGKTDRFDLHEKIDICLYSLRDKIHARRRSRGAGQRDRMTGSGPVGPQHISREDRAMVDFSIEPAFHDKLDWMNDFATNNLPPPHSLSHSDTHPPPPPQHPPS